MSLFFKKNITILVLASFLAVVFFGIATMIHGPNGRLSADCPLSAMGDSACPQDIFSASVHHLSAYYSFFNVPAGSTFVLIISFLLLILLILVKVFLNTGQAFWPISNKQFYESPPVLFLKREVKRWLALLENSPSLIRKRSKFACLSFIGNS